MSEYLPVNQGDDEITLNPKSISHHPLDELDTINIDVEVSADAVPDHDLDVKTTTDSSNNEDGNDGLPNNDEIEATDRESMIIRTEELQLQETEVEIADAKKTEHGNGSVVIDADVDGKIVNDHGHDDEIVEAPTESGVHRRDSAAMIKSNSDEAIGISFAIDLDDGSEKRNGGRRSRHSSSSSSSSSSGSIDSLDHCCPCCGTVACCCVCSCCRCLPPRRLRNTVKNVNQCSRWLIRFVIHDVGGQSSTLTGAARSKTRQIDKCDQLTDQDVAYKVARPRL